MFILHIFQLSGGTLWASSTLSNLCEVCWTVLYRDQSFWELNNNQKDAQVPNDISNYLCANNCSQHGVCNGGICTCEDGYLAVDCSMHESTPPMLYTDYYYMNSIQDGLNESLYVFGEGFPDGGVTSCHLDKVKLLSLS